jgi:ABC-type transport system involved in multi-copper enzyme maturation permease subunit
MSSALLFPDPITTKELSGIARRWQTYAARGLYVGLFGIIVWNFSSDLRFTFDDRYSQSILADLGQRIFFAFLPLQSTLVLLTAISSASDLVTKEVRTGTLGLLASTPLSSWRVAFGKWKAAVAQGLILLLCGAPILAICSSLGGAPPGEILCVLVLTAAGAALGAALSLFCSSLVRSGTTALLTATVVFAAYLALPALLLDRQEPSSMDFIYVAQAHLLVAFEGSLKHPPLPEVENSWRSAAALTTGLALLFVRITALRIAALAVRTPAAPLVTRAFDRLDRFYEGIGPEEIRRVRFLDDRGGVWQRGAILWKELKTRASGRLRNSVRIALVLLVVLAFTLRLDLSYFWIPAFATTILIWFLALANGASLFVKEKEERKWDILLATPLESRQILAAKLLAGLVPVIPMVAASLFFWGLQFGTGILPRAHLFPAATAVAMPALLAYLLGAACSLRAHSLRNAFLFALSLALGVVLLLPLLISEMDPPRRGFYYEHERCWFHPIKQLSLVCDGTRYGNFWSFSAVSSEESWSLLIVYLLLSGGILGYLSLRFDRITGRSR